MEAADRIVAVRHAALASTIQRVAS